MMATRAIAAPALRNARRAGSRDGGPRSSIRGSVHRHRGKIHEPAFRLHEIPDLRAHRARSDIVGDPKERRLVDRTLVQGPERLAAPGRVETYAPLAREPVELRIVDEAPVVGDRGRHLRVEEADHGK